ncbi:MAG TPA: ferritin family protein [Acidobacteriota bacterium]|nr:ferritin family protein [Acidobacteriota bacterium]
MDIVEFAMQMELDGKAFYERAAEATAQPELKKILIYLAEEEERHYQVFRQLHDGRADRAEEELDGNSGSLSAPRNLFLELAGQGPDQSFGDDARAVWTEALKIEEAAVRMYSDEAAKEKDPARKKLLNRIADEERDHVYLIDNMLSFIADPQTFVNSRQFADFRSWEGH